MNQTCPHEKAERVELAIPKVIINFWDCLFLGLYNKKRPTLDLFL